MEVERYAAESAASSLNQGLVFPVMLMMALCLAPVPGSAEAFKPGLLSQDLLIKDTTVIPPERRQADNKPAVPQQKPAPKPNTGKVEWAYSTLGVYGPTYTSPDGSHKITLGLFVWLDNTFVTDDELARPLGRNKIDGDSRLRTARLELHGFYGQRFSYYFRADFSDAGSGSGDVNVEWAALGIQDLPIVQNLLVGLQQPLYGLDIWANYPRARLFLEPSLINAFYRGPLLGITAFDVNLEHNYSWALGVARDTTEERLAGLHAVDTHRGSGDGIVNGRISWFPRYRERGRYLLDFGLSGAYIKPQNNRINYGFYPEIFTTDADLFPFVDIQKVDQVAIGVLEFRLAQGPFWLQSDYLHNRTERKHAPDLDFNAFYVEGGYFITGEQTVFRPLALNGEIAPTPHFDPGKGKYGAVEIKARYSRLDLTDAEFRGGNLPGPGLNPLGARVENYTVGVEWYLNAHVQISAEFVHSIRHDLDNAAYDAIQTRLAWSL